MTVQESRLGGSSSANLSSVSEDILPDTDATRDLGSDTKRWALIYAVLAVLGSATIGGILLYSSGNTLYINGSLFVNGSLNVSENVTAQYFYGDGSQLTGLAGGGDITEVNTPGSYITGGAISGAVNLNFNETKLNETVAALDTDTTYTNTSFNTESIPGNVSCSRINGSASDLCSLVDTDTDTDTNTNVTKIEFTGGSTKTLNLEQGNGDPANLTASFIDWDTTYTNSSFNVESIPGRVTHNSTTNLTMQDNYAICLGSSGCADSYIKFNGTTLIIKVN